LFSSADITIINHPLYSSGQAIAAVEEASKKSLPFGFGYEYGGLTRQEILAGNQAPFIFALCLIFVYLLLAAKYESWLLPIPILLTLPFGIFGALAFQIFLWLITSLFGGSGSMLPQFNLYAQIGMIMLIGLVAKNAILIVEFARQKHEEGLGVVEAAIEGAKLRFRPILMTSFAFILGVLPLVTASGAGAASRHSLGASVLGGMLFATMMGIVVVPTLYVIFQNLENRMKNKKPKALKTVINDSEIKS
jgi:HAE1 family hydrophobic/amphiphilic exporter-1